MQTTKKIAPWKLKVGDKLLQDGRFNTVKSVQKSVGVFTGKPMWTAITDALIYEDFSVFHAKINRLPCQKATILTSK